MYIFWCEGCVGSLTSTRDKTISEYTSEVQISPKFMIIYPYIVFNFLTLLT